MVRFANALGFDGWKDFAKTYVSEQHYQQTHYSNIDPNLPFAADSSTRDIIAQMQALQSEALADTAELLSLKPDSIVLATGSQPVMPPIPGIRNEKFVSVADILDGRVLPGARCLVIGGGMALSQNSENR